MNRMNDDLIKELALEGLRNRLQKAAYKRHRLEQAALELKELEAKNAEANQLLGQLTPVAY